MTEQYRVPTTLYPTNIESLYQRAERTGKIIEDNVLIQAANALKVAKDIADSSGELATALKRDKTLTPEARALRLKQSVTATAQRGASALDGALATIDTEIERLELSTSSPPPGDPAIASELRSRLASMRGEVRSEVLSTAIREKDDQVLSAVLGAPSLLSGLSKSEAESLRLRYRQAVHSDTLARINRLRTARERTQKAGQAFMGLIKNASTDPQALMAEAGQAATNQAAERLAALAEERNDS